MAKILIVDDEEDVVNFLADELQQAGHETGSAFDGVSAVLDIIDGGWDIVLMDIRMPRLDGIGALKIIKKIKPACPVIMFTGQAGQEDISESTRLGAYSCLLKPVAIENLLAVIQNCVRDCTTGPDRNSQEREDGKNTGRR